MKSIKVEPETDRIVADLSHFLGRLKKDVLRDAVLMFADLHGHAVERGITQSTERAAAASGSAEGAVLLASVGGDLSTLPLRDRVTVQRSQLLALIERCGAANPRLIGELAAGRPSDVVELLIESDLYGPSWHQFEAMHLAQRLLDAPVEFTDATGLALFAPERLARLEGEAVPL